MRALKFTTSIVWLAVMLTACLSDTANTDGSPASRAGAAGSGAEVVFPPANHFKLNDHQGRTVDLRQFKGKIVVLNFWATWCPPCRFEVPHLIQLRNTFSPDQVAIIGVSLDRGTAAQVQPLLNRFIAQYGINYPVVIDSDFALLQQYFKRDLATLGVPTTYVIDQQGRLYRTHEGLPLDANGQPNPGAVLTREIQTLLNRM